MENFVGRYKRFLELFIIIFCIFFIKNIAFADYTQNFDAFSAGQPISDVLFWTEQTVGLATISTTTSISSPNSVLYNGAYVAGNVYFGNGTYKLDNHSIYIKQTAYQPSSQAIANYNGTREISLTMSYGGGYHSCRLNCQTSTSTVYMWFDYNLDHNWHKYTWKRDDANHESIYIDDVLITTCFIDDVDYTVTRFNGQYTGTYLDNFNITIAEPVVDDIIFINPVNSSIQSINDFYWEYNLKIASSTYWTTYEYLNVDLVFVHYTNLIADATTTLSVLREPMNTYVPNTYYNYQITDPVSFPTQNGAYQAVIGLKGVYSDGTSDTLDTDAITFGIATTTPTTPTAWCSNLCLDIATSTDLLGFIGNGVNCALRSATCYLFYPHQYNINQFFTQYEAFKQVFPFNTFFDIASTTQNAFASSTMSNNTSFGLPNIRKTGTTTQYYIQPLLGSSTMANFVGSTNATLFRNSISYLMYAITAGGIFLILWL